MAVIPSRCIARADCFALDLLAAGGRLIGSPRRHRCPTLVGGLRGGVSFGVRSRCSGTGAMGLGLPFLGPEGYERGTYTLARRRANLEKARFAWRAGRGRAYPKRGDFSGPRLHREEGDGFIIGRRPGEIKWRLRRRVAGPPTAVAVGTHGPCGQSANVRVVGSGNQAGDQAFPRGVQLRSGMPARALASLAITNSRSARRLSQWTTSGPTASRAASAVTRRSARRHTVRA